MPTRRITRTATVALLAVASVTACRSATTSTPVAATPTAMAGATTLLVRLGNDTLGVEQYRRTPARMEGVLVQRVPFATVARYAIDLGANSVPTRAEYSLRRGDGTMITGAMQSLSMQFSGDSVYFVGHRASGDTSRAAAMRGQLLPYVNGSYALFELALSRMLATGRDSADFAIVPLNFAVRNTTPLPVKLLGRTDARINWFGFPLMARHDGRGNIESLDGTRTTIKVRVDRIASIDVDSLARQWTARDQATGPVGATSPRDTVRATLGRAHVWIDYGRPSTRGRDVWVNGVLGDTIWRTGANAATQLGTDADLVIGGTTVPAGTYSLWTWATPRGYQLIVNKQSGQWGTEYHAERDLARIPLREGTASTAAERFVVALDPPSGSSSTLRLTWGTKELSVPISAK